MENSLAPNHTKHDFRNELLNFCLSIKRASNVSIIKDNITLSSSSHEIKLNSFIKYKPLTPYNYIESVDNISSDSYFSTLYLSLILKPHFINTSLKLTKESIKSIQNSIMTIVT